MFIQLAKRFHENKDGSISVYPNYRLMKAYRDTDGKPRKRAVLSLGALEGMTDADREELADLLTVMIETGQCVFCEDRTLYEMALSYYAKYRETRYAQENDPILIAERERKERERRRDAITIKLSTLTQHEARTIGSENLCNSTLRLLKVREFLNSKGWTREQTDLALMQIIARAVHPYSEQKTVRYLQENTALAEMFKIPKQKITKDALYKSAHRLWDVHREMEDWLHERVCSVFNLEEKILLLDITNTYFEGRMDKSEICQYGRSKEKRTDCKIVVLAAVVNTEGLIVRTMIYEGNRHDSTTIEDIVGSLANDTSADARKIVVMDAGFYSKENVKWITDHGFDYITVLPSADGKFIATSDEVIQYQDSREQEIRLQMGKVVIDDEECRALLVDSDAKALKEKSMYDQACKRYEEGLESIRAGIMTKGGTKKRDAVNNRLGKLDQKYGAIRKNYTVTFTYAGKGKDEKAISMTWTRNTEKSDAIQKFHGKYVLITSLDETDEVNIWEFYNVIRTVEETFHVLKTDLDIRPVYHKTDGGIKAHLNLAVLAYWVVSVTKHRLKVKGYRNVRWDEIMRIASTQVVVTAKVQTEDGREVSIRQSTQAEDKLGAIYDLLDINPHPLGKVKSVGPPKLPSKNDGT